MRKACWILLGLLAGAPSTRADFVTTEHLAAFADFRLRLESDFDSQTETGEPREDRTRLRVRARIGLRYQPDEHWRFEVRLRSGQQGSQQSPHITILDFDGNDTGDASFDLDRWYARGRVGSFWALAGRDRLPIWRQDEELFDDDVTFAGIAVGGERAIGPGTFSGCGGYFSAPVGMRAFSGNLSLVQLVYQPRRSDLHWTLALTGSRYHPDPDDPDAAGLLQNNGSRDYSIVELSAQARWPVRGRPLVLGADLMRNTEDYSPDDPDPLTAANFDQTDGYELLATYGDLETRNAWLVGYFHSRIELFAVLNSYSQDDSVRWGTATQVRASNARADELRFGWAFDGKTSLVVRLFLVESITTVEDGNRLRIEFNYLF